MHVCRFYGEEYYDDEFDGDVYDSDSLAPSDMVDQAGVEEDDPYEGMVDGDDDYLVHAAMLDQAYIKFGDGPQLIEGYMDGLEY